MYTFFDGLERRIKDPVNMQIEASILVQHSDISKLVTTETRIVREYADRVTNGKNRSLMPHCSLPRYYKSRQDEVRDSLIW